MVIIEVVEVESDVVFFPQRLKSSRKSRLCFRASVTLKRWWVIWYKRSQSTRYSNVADWALSLTSLESVTLHFLAFYFSFVQSLQAMADGGFCKLENLFMLLHPYHGTCMKVWGQHGVLVLAFHIVSARSLSCLPLDMPSWRYNLPRTLCPSLILQ